MGIKDEIKKEYTTSSKYIITNLEKNTKYDVCIRIVSKSFGKSECSNKVVIRTAVESEDDKTELEKFLDRQFNDFKSKTEDKLDATEKKIVQMESDIGNFKFGRKNCIWTSYQNSWDGK